jgi:hypothetical protein
MTYIFGAIIAIIGISVILTAHSYLKMTISLSREYHRATEAFFSAVKPLLSDDETPSEILMTLRSLNKTISERKSARMLFKYLADDRWRRADFSNRNKIYVEFFHRRPELEAPIKTRS